MIVINSLFKATSFYILFYLIYNILLYFYLLKLELR